MWRCSSGGVKVVFDVDHDGVADAGEPVFLSVTTGKAMVFFHDLNGDNSFGLDEFAGLSLGDGFAGIVGTDVKAVATTLTSSDTFTRSTLQPSNVASLTVKGAIHEHFFVGGNVSNVSIGSPLRAHDESQSVQSIRTGTAANGMVAVFGNETLTFTFTPVSGADGGDITNVTIAAGTDSILAGNGNAGGDGGSVSLLKIRQPSQNLTIRGGAGGGGGGGAAGDGGSVEKVTVFSGYAGVVEMTGGSGGIVSGAQNGANGGAVRDIGLTIVSKRLWRAEGIGE